MTPGKFPAGQGDACTTATIARARAIAAAVLTASLCAIAWADGPTAEAPAKPPKAGQAAGEPLASVNGYTITTEDVARYLRLMHETPPEAEDPFIPLQEREQRGVQKRKEALQALIELRLLYEQGLQEYFGSEPSAETLKKVADEEYRKFEQRAGSKLAAMQVLAEAGVTADQYRDILMQDLVAGEVLRDKILSRVSITPGEVRAYYDGHAAELKLPKTFVYRQILLTVIERSEEPAQRRQAEQLLAELKGGADFAKLADAWSADRENHPGGLHEVQVPEEAGDWVPPAVAGLAPGQVSEVRAVAGGLCIARLDEVKPARTAAFEEVQGVIKAKIFAAGKVAAQADYLAELKGKAHVQYFPAAGELGLP
jgi:parvulin-like peptidyl-prolyl isomerase